MQRQPEPELMNDPLQVQAYANADFEAAHSEIVQHFSRVFPDVQPSTIVDLGCGTADISIRFAKLFSHSQIDAVDAAPEMLKQAQLQIKQYDLQSVITLHCCTLKDCNALNAPYQAIISNSLLHHLHEPGDLWNCIDKFASESTAIFIADLFRPTSQQQAQEMVNHYASNEPEILQRDFYNSLLAAFTLEEVADQLSQAGLNRLKIEQISDRHMLIYGHQ